MRHHLVQFFLSFLGKNHQHPHPVGILLSRLRRYHVDAHFEAHRKEKKEEHHDPELDHHIEKEPEIDAEMKTRGLNDVQHGDPNHDPIHKQECPKNRLIEKGETTDHSLCHFYLPHFFFSSRFRILTEI